MATYCFNGTSNDITSVVVVMGGHYLRHKNKVYPFYHIYVQSWISMGRTYNCFYIYVYIMITRLIVIVVIVDINDAGYCLCCRPSRL